jgi:hypothetical protein
VSRRRDSEVSGRTDGNTVVNMAGTSEWLGRVLPVRVLRAGPHSVGGQVIERPA